MHCDDLGAQTPPDGHVGRAEVERHDLDLLHLDEHAAGGTRVATEARGRVVELDVHVARLGRRVSESMVREERVDERVAVGDLLPKERVDFGFFRLHVALKVGLLLHEALPDL